MFSSPGVREAEWASHIVAEADFLLEELGQSPDLDHLDDGLVRRGVERSFSIIAEAVARFHRANIDLPALEPGVDWPGWRRFGDHIRHGYDRLDAGVIQHSLVYEITPLHAAALRLKARFEAEAS